MVGPSPIIVELFDELGEVQGRSLLLLLFFMVKKCPRLLFFDQIAQEEIMVLNVFNLIFVPKKLQLIKI